MKTISSILAAAVAIVALGSGTAYADYGMWKPTHGDRTTPRYDPTPSSPSTYKCSGDLGYLRRVYEEEVDFVVRVSIMPICDTEDYGLMRSEGNAGALRQHIGENEYMLEALFRANYGVDDVVGVRMTGEDKAILYVHRFHHR